MRWRIKLQENDEPIEVSLLEIKEETYRFQVGDEIVSLDEPKVQNYSIRTKDLRLTFEAWTQRKWRAVSGSETYTLEPISWEASAKTSAREVRSEMPGRILKVLVKAGDQLAPNQSLLIIEAMKMENEIRAVSKAKVKSVQVIPGQSVESGALLIELEA